MGRDACPNLECQTEIDALIHTTADKACDLLIDIDRN